MEYRGSAYVAKWDSRKNVLFTAAHNLLYFDENGEVCESKNILFIPGMKDIHDSSDKRPYGKYTAEGFAVHREWNPTTGKTKDDYDFGIILLKSRKDDKNVCDVVDPITIDFDREAKEGDTWETLGYPVRDENPNVAIMKQTGVFVEKVGGHISKISKMEAFGDGGSGCVWLSAKSEMEFMCQAVFDTHYRLHRTLHQT